MENIIAVSFKIESEGYQAITELRNNPVRDEFAVSQAILAKKEDGAIKVLDSFDTGMETANDTMIGGLVGGLFGIIGGPFGMLLMGSMGAMVGSMVDMDDAISNSSLIEKALEVFGNGEVALIALVQETVEGALDKAISKSDADVIKLDAAEIAEEIHVAQELQKEMEKEARKRLREEKKEERKKNSAERREKIRADFDNLKKKFSKKEKDPSE